VVDSLEQPGWVRRTPEPGNRRALRVELTAAGREKALAVYGVLEATTVRIGGQLSASELAAVRRGLATMRSTGRNELNAELQRLAREE
jgi:DNA-binding MarR family transcriptional regulator